MLPQFILASASPARRRLLQSVGIDAIARPSYFDESQVQSSDPAELVQALALRKAETIAAQLEPSNTPVLIMGCDSVLAIQGEIHGKPANPEEAIARWQQMRGQVGELYTGHVLIELQEAEGRGQRAEGRTQFSIPTPPTPSPTPPTPSPTPPPHPLHPLPHPLHHPPPHPLHPPLVSLPVARSQKFTLLRSAIARLPPMLLLESRSIVLGASL
ncbi:Maf family protein [Kovacikia minuta CCNUW1]|uniref:Maf family protein n=1 Tax=Kovacikia minuta TaxID=2931930 RepID=UPI001CCCBD60|nr:Maf family protein [Kovacikia minuta CCNUW1]